MTERLFYGNEAENYGIALGTFVAIAIVIALLARYGPITQALRRRRNRGVASSFDTYLLRHLETTFVPLAYVAAAFGALSTLHLDSTARHVLREVGIAVTTWALVRIGIGLFRFSVEASIARSAERGLSGANLRSFVPFATILGWGFALVFVLDEWGFHVSAIVAGLGIGGAAVALAAQSPCAIGSGISRLSRIGRSKSATSCKSVPSTSEPSMRSACARSACAVCGAKK